MLYLQLVGSAKAVVRCPEYAVAACLLFIGRCDIDSVCSHTKLDASITLASLLHACSWQLGRCVRAGERLSTLKSV